MELVKNLFDIDSSFKEIEKIFKLERESNHFLDYKRMTISIVIDEWVSDHAIGLNALYSYSYDAQTF